MAQTWKYAIGLGLLGSALASGCVVTTGGDPDLGDAGEAGSGGTTGGSGGKGGATTGGSAGKGGSSGKGGTAGTNGTTGGSAGKGGAAGSGGTTGGSAGTGGGAGMSAGTGGTEPTDQDKVPECDPASGDLDNTPYPNCAPADPQDPDPCEVCIQESCCEESIACYGFAPGNVCGWGGPTDGEYTGAGEIGCYVACLAAYVTEFEVCDEDGMGSCFAECQTAMCGDVLGNQTSDLATCIHASCNDECLGIATCE